MFVKAIWKFQVNLKRHRADLYQAPKELTNRYDAKSLRLARQRKQKQLPEFKELYRRTSG